MARQHKALFTIADFYTTIRRLDLYVGPSALVQMAKYQPAFEKYFQSKQRGEA